METTNNVKLIWFHHTNVWKCTYEPVNLQMDPGEHDVWNQSGLLFGEESMRFEAIPLNTELDKSLEEESMDFFTQSI